MDIIAMTYERFIAETNIMEIIQRRREVRKEALTDTQISVLVQKYYQRRLQIVKWSSCGLNHLKLKMCKCNRLIKTTEAFTQYETNQSRSDSNRLKSTRNENCAEVRRSQWPEQSQTQDTVPNEPLNASDEVPAVPENMDAKVKKFKKN